MIYYRYRGVNPLINGKTGEIVEIDGEYVVFKVLLHEGEDLFRVKMSSLTETN